MSDFQRKYTVGLRRSVLSVPAINVRALAKVHGLDCDAVIFDLEDSVAPDMKEAARQNLRQFFKDTPLQGRETIIRINAMASDYGAADLQLALECQPDAVLLPKVDEPSDVLDVVDVLSDADAPDSLRIWAMVETPRAILNIAAIAEAARTPDARLDCFVVGLNDLRKETGVADQAGRTYLVPWLMQTVLAARAYGMDVIDSVFNDFRDDAAFSAECEQGRAMGFDGKMLIHPGQIEAANNSFGPRETALAEASAIIAAFGEPAAVGLNVINMNGRMVERLHMEQAQKLVQKADAIAARKAGKT